MYKHTSSPMEWTPVIDRFKKVQICPSSRVTGFQLTIPSQRDRPVFCVDGLKLPRGASLLIHLQTSKPIIFQMEFCSIHIIIWVFHIGRQISNLVENNGQHMTSATYFL